MTGLLRVDGVVTFWSAGKWSSRDALLGGWGSLGYGKCVPEQRRDLACLKDALAVVYPGYLVRALQKRDGFAIYEERMGLTENSYHRHLTVKVEESGSLIYPIDKPNDDARDKIIAAMCEQRGLLTGGQITGALVSLLQRLGATTLKPSGGVYWLSGQMLADWQGAAGIVEAAGIGRASKVYVIKHQMDADAMRAVRDALIGEVEADTARISKEVAEGDLGNRAIAHRAAEAEALLRKVEEYERVLGESLPTLRNLCEHATTAACSAAILESAGVTEAGA